VPDEQLEARLAALPLWSLEPSRLAITRAFTARNFASAVSFFNAVAGVAEAEGHHPDLHLTNYRDVRLVLSTHAVGGCAAAATMRHEGCLVLCACTWHARAQQR
jgi:4a-hydroxytetrahydrobiopterin dehydratase